jgi:uncharacterized protein YjbI with pentapeptide repeats
MGQIRQVLAWVWARQQHITFIATLAMVILGVVGIASVIYAAQAVRLQYRQYEEEAFNREQGSASLAWRTIADANLNPSEIGQSNAFRFLVLKSQMNGNVTLDGSSLSIHQASISEKLNINLSSSNLCGSTLDVLITSHSRIGLENSLLIGTRITGRLMHADFTGADLQQALIKNVRAPWVKFIASTLIGTDLVGGSFEDADFQGANLTGLQTHRGFEGASPSWGFNPADRSYNDDFLPPGYAFETYIPDREDAVFSKPSKWEVNDETFGHAVSFVDFRRARFLKADIRGADLASSTIDQAQVDEACADQTTKLPDGIMVRSACVEEDWVGRRRALIQQKTYHGRSKALEICKAASSEPHWK